MLDNKVSDLVDRMTRVQFNERQGQLQHDIALAQSQMAARGLGRSGAIVQRVYELCSRDVEIRTLLIWQTLVRVLSQVGVRYLDDLARDLKQEIRKYLSSILDYPNDCLQKIVQQIGIGMATSLSDVREQAFMKVDAEIDLFVLSLLRQTEAREGKTESSGQIFNFYSPIGAIQTGPSATANVVMNLSHLDREALREALERVKEGLSIVEDLPGHPKEEVLDLVEEAKTEVGKPRPNGMRLGSVLMAVGTAIQTVGSLQPAYQALKAALLPLGIPLP